MRPFLLVITGLVLGGLIGAWVFDTLWGSDNHMNVSGLAGLLIGGFAGGTLGILLGVALGRRLDRVAPSEFEAEGRRRMVIGAVAVGGVQFLSGIPLRGFPTVVCTILGAIAGPFGTGFSCGG